MPRWTVNVGADEVIVVERTVDGWVIDIPSHQPVVADRAAVEDLRLKLGASLAVEGGE